MPENPIETTSQQPELNASSRPGWARAAGWIGAMLLLILAIAAVIALFAWKRVEPFLRARVVNSLAARFRAKVELDQFHASAAHGFAIEGHGLRIVPFGLEAYPPVISVDSFSFHMGLGQLFSARRHVRLVIVDGLHITLPPRAARSGFHLTGEANSPSGPSADSREHFPDHSSGPSLSHSSDHSITAPKLYVDEILAHDATLTLATDKPGKLPLVFDIHSLRLVTKWDTGAMHYTAALRNARPTGEIESQGDFGPWDASNPRSTPLTGDYTFNNADLATTKGIAGMLHSTGHFSGPLEQLTVDGKADVPDFRIQEAQHPVALFTTFHAIVDGTSGDTYLQPVQAHFRNSWFTCTGSVIKVKEADQATGHHIRLHVDMIRGRAEDLLWLAVKTAPPVVTGNVQLHSSFDLLPDPTHSLTVARRATLKGTVSVTQMHFTDAKVDEKVDSISLRTQVKAAEAKQLKDDGGADAVSLDGTLRGNFTLQHAIMNLNPATFTLPGVDATVTGNYSLDGQQFDFSGNAKLQATVSQMFTGWKSMLLKPIDPLFSKHGAGTYIPFHIGGTKQEPTFGVDIGSHRIEIKR